MSKNIDNAIDKRVKKILEKDSLTDDDLKFLALYNKKERKSPFDILLGGIKKFIDILNTPDDEGDE